MRFWILLILFLFKLPVSFATQATSLDSILHLAAEVSPEKAFTILLGGALHFKDTNLPHMQTLSQEAYDLAVTNGWKDKEIDALHELASATYLMGDYEKTMTWNEQIIDHYQSIGDSIQLALHLNMVVLLQRKLKQPKAGLRNLDRALSICQEEKDSTCWSINEDHRGLIYMDLQEYDNALAAFNRCRSIREVVKDTIGLGYIFDRLGQLYNVMGQPERGLDMMERSLRIRKMLKDSLNIAMNLANMGELYLLQHKPEKALEVFEEALPISEKVQFIDLIRFILEGQSQAYLQMDRYELAFQKLQSSYGLKDSLLNLDRQRAVLDIQAKYDSERKQRQIERAEARNRFLWITGASILIGLILLGTIGILWFRRKQESNFQKKLLRSTLEAEERERGRIARELHDGIGQQLVSLRLQMENKDLDTSQKVADITSDVRLLSHQLMPRELENHDLEDALHQILKESCQAAGIEYSFSNAGAIPKLEDSVKLSLYRITQELIQNILKHADAKQVDVLLHGVQDKVILTIEDDGKGFQNVENSSGIGLLNIQSRLQGIGGHIHFEQKEHRGTIVTVRIPLSKAS